MNKDYEYLEKFKEISLRKICLELGVDPSNLYGRRLKKEVAHQVRIELEKRLTELNTEKRIRKIKSKKKRIRKKRLRYDNE